MKKRQIIKFKKIKNPTPLIEVGIKKIMDCLEAVLALERKQLNSSDFFWHPAPKETRLPKGCLYAFTSDSSLSLRFFSTMIISDNLNNLGLLPLSAKGKRLKKLKASEQNMVEKIQSLSCSKQRKLLSNILSNDAVFSTRVWAQGYRLDFSEVRKISQQADTFEDLFNKLLAFHGAKKAKFSTSKKNSINLAVLWLAIYFYSEGLADFVSDDFLQETGGLNTAFVPFRGSVFFLLLRAERSIFISELIKLVKTNKGDGGWILKRLLLTRKFRSALNPENYFEALHNIKMGLDAAGRLTRHSSTLLNNCHSLVTSHFQVPSFEIRYSEFFGGGAQHKSSFSRGLFSWILHPDYSSYRNFNKYTGFEIPSKVPTQIKQWAELCANIVPEFQNVHIASVVSSLDLWLVYLFKLYQDYPSNFPNSLAAVTRNFHVARSQKFFTFMTFLDSNDLGEKTKDKALAVLEKMCALADSKFNLGLPALPINRKFDKYNTHENRRYSTHRDAIPLAQFKTIIEENRQNNFAFAQSLMHGQKNARLYDRLVRNIETGSYETVFFPAIPIVLDLILTSGARSKDALRVDSGEGDEIVYSAEGVARQNPLQTAKRDRQLGVLRTFNTSVDSNEKVITGLNFIDSKTGPYNVPYVDPQTALFLESMRDWQSRYFPISNPVKLMSNIDRQAKNDAMFTDTYPLFRDPANRAKFSPPATSTLREYWKKLLRHCEQKHFSDTGNPNVFTVEENPIWDVHSIRVTNITVLLENGVPPNIVAMLVGHKSLLMTLHYRSPNITNVHETMVSAQASIEKELLDTLLGANETDEDIDTTWNKFDSLLFATDDGRAMLKQISKTKTPPDIFIHGLCPGANCSKGLAGNVRGGTAVFRYRACSKCRFRITGPAFLNGLVWRYNSLVAEYKLSIEKEKGVRHQMGEAEHKGKSLLARRLKLNANGIELERDNLLEELALEARTINKCLQMAPEDKNALILYEKNALEVVHKEVHDFTLFQNVIYNAKHYYDAEHEVPDGLIEKRTQILRKIAKTNGLQELYFKLTEDQHSAASEAFCNLLASSTQLDEIISGEVRLVEVEDLREGLENVSSQTNQGISFLGSNLNETK